MNSRLFTLDHLVAAFRETGVTEYWHGVRESVRLRTREFHHLCPLLGFVSDELAELGRRSRQRRAAEVSETGLDLRVVESRVDLLIELVDDLSRRGLRYADAEPNTYLVARHELSHGR